MALVAWLIFDVPHSDVVAFLTLGAVGLGVSIAVFTEIRRQRQPWTWTGILRALHHPSRNFVLAFVSHTPQLLIAVAIALYWRNKGR